MPLSPGSPPRPTCHLAIPRVPWQYALYCRYPAVACGASPSAGRLRWLRPAQRGDSECVRCHRQRIGIAGRGIALGASIHAIVRRSVDEKGRGTEIKTQGGILWFGQETRQATVQEPNACWRSPSTSGFVAGAPRLGQTARKCRGRRRAHQRRWGGEQGFSIPEQCHRTRLGVIELHAMIKGVVFETRASAMHRRSGRGHDVNNRGLGAISRGLTAGLPAGVLRHQGVRVAFLGEQDGHHAGPDHNAAATHSNEQIGCSSTRGFCGTLHRWPGGILVHGVEDPGIERTELGRDALQEVVRCATVWPQMTKARCALCRRTSSAWVA